MTIPIIRFDGWTLNPQSGELGRGEVHLRLPEQPLQILQALVERPGEVVPREQLITRLWPTGVVDFETGLNTAVRKLRVALGDMADTPRYIETLPRRGYRFIGRLEPAAVGAEPGRVAAPPEAMAPAASAGAPSAAGTAAETSAEIPARQDLRRIRRASLAALLACLALGGWYLARNFWQSGSRSLHAGSGAASRTDPAPRYSLAVLPFANLSGDPGQEAFVDGLSEELLEALAHVDGLQVAGRTSSFHFKGTDVDLREIGAQLGVASILEGSVRRSGQMARIHAQLIDAKTGYRLWSQTYDRNVGDILAAQTEIAGAVVGALKLTVDNTATRIELGGTRNAAAMNAYLRGLRLSDATVKTAPEARALVDAFDEALQLDPGFALAYAARARALMGYGGYFTLDATRDAFARARADAERAIALAPAAGESHAALAEAYEYGYLDFPHAAPEFARAVELSPGNARVLRAYAEFAGNMGDFDKAISAARRNVALDPFNVPGHHVLGEVLVDARKYTEAVAEFDEATRLAPDRASEVYQNRGRALYLLGKYEAAAASCEAEPDRYEAQTCLPLVYEKLGRHAEAESMLATAVAEQGDFSAYQFMEIYAQWGNIPKALEWLDVAVRLQDPGLDFLKVDPFLDPLRSQARFQAAERALQFPE